MSDMEGATSCPHTSSGRQVHIVPDFGAYRDNPTLTDVIVVVGTTEFKCHRVILAAASDFFKTAFTCGLREDCERKITLKAIDKNIFSTILTYMYTGNIKLTEENLSDIWRAADMLQIAPVMKECEEFFKTVLRLDNCFEFFFQVKLLSEKFRRRMLDLIADNFVNLRGSSNFNRLDAEDMKYLICSDRLNLAHEDDLIETLLQWAENDPFDESIDESHGPGVTRVQHLADLLECTRYSLMSRRFFGERLSCHPLVRADARCVALVERILRCHAQTYLLQEWCPPASMQRVQSKMVNSLVGVKIDRSCKNNNKDGDYFDVLFFAFNLQTKQMTTRRFVEFMKKSFFQIVYHDDKMYIFPGEGSVAVYWAEADVVKNLGQHEIFKSRLCVISDSLYTCCEEQNGKAVVSRISFHSLHSFSIERLSYHQVGSLHLDVQESTLQITSIENMLVMFCKCQDGVSIIFFDSFSGMSTRISTDLRIPSNDRFVTLRRDKEVFVLEENGRFWRIRHCQTAQDFKLIHELTFWDETWPRYNELCGAALVNDELHVVFKQLEEEEETQQLQEQQRPSNPMNGDLAGVFNKLVMIEHPLRPNDRNVPPVIHAVIPEAVFERRYHPNQH
ncbi:kelch-like protein 40a [Plakobranchus ocellatus]|uniref:Kelch-like protein 40a n=1 Tax=Plakobranchus ocellatus TaxID=259542 RepID=A0AAV4CIW8_9GAST|nr:kelch-like protein 40a [Plakobranchus ocellatus]